VEFTNEIVLHRFDLVCVPGVEARYAEGDESPPGEDVLQCQLIIMIKYWI
jgi:hypothetical protein